MAALSRLWFILLLVYYVYFTSCHGFVCKHEGPMCQPYSKEVYAKDCPKGFHKCSNHFESNGPSIFWHDNADESRLAVLETSYQAFSQDPCIPQAKVGDGHFDCPHRDDEEHEVLECPETEVKCLVKDKMLRYFTKKTTICFEKQLFCNVTTDDYCVDSCELKIEAVTPTKSKSQIRVECDKELEFDCGSFCIPKVWQHDLQVDCANKQDEAGAPESIFKCHVDEIKCPNEAKCIHQDHLCDGEVDCLGATDEFNCSRACPVSLHQCSNGQCIAQNLTCDGVHDCFDKSDEANCSSVKYRDDNLIICAPLDVHVSKDLVCDGNADCPNGFDERNCSISPICDNLHFECKTDNMCVPRTYLCDGIKDCHDGSDEASCPEKRRTCKLPLKLCQDGSCQKHCKDDVCPAYTLLYPNGECGSVNNLCPRAFGFGFNIFGWTCDDVVNKTFYRCDPKDALCVNATTTCCDGKFTYYQCRYGYSDPFNRGCERNNAQLVTNYCADNNRFCYPGFFKLQNGELLIEEKYNAKILMTSLNEVSTYDIMTGKVESLMKDFGSISASVYWIKNQTFFWADSELKQILYCHFSLDGSNPSKRCEETTFVLVSNITTHSITLDWTHETLYFTDDVEMSINFISMRFPLRSTLIRDSYQSFRGIQMDPSVGLIYYIGSGMIRTFHIGFQEIVEEYIDIVKELGTPEEILAFLPTATSAMYADFYSKAVYFAQPKYGRINSFLNGRMKQHYVSDEIYNPIHSLALFGEQLFWTDRYGLHTTDRNNVDGDALHLAPGVGRHVQLQVIHKTAQPPFTDKCDGHVCDQICLPISWSFRKHSNLTHVCECVDGYTLVDEKCVADDKLHAVLTNVSTTTAKTTTVWTTSTSTMGTTTTSPMTRATRRPRPSHASFNGPLVHKKVEDHESGYVMMTLIVSVCVAASIIALAFFAIKKYRHKPITNTEAISFNDLRNNEQFDEIMLNPEILPGSIASFNNPAFEN